MVVYFKGTCWVLDLSKRHCVDAVREQEAKAVFDEETYGRIQIAELKELKVKCKICSAGDYF